MTTLMMAVDDAWMNAETKWIPTAFQRKMVLFAIFCHVYTNMSIFE